MNTWPSSMAEMMCLQHRLQQLLASFMWVCQSSRLLTHLQGGCLSCSATGSTGSPAEDLSPVRPTSELCFNLPCLIKTEPLSVAVPAGMSEGYRQSVTGHVDMHW